MDVQINESFCLKDLDISPRDFIISSIEKTTDYKTLEGSNRRLFNGAVDSKRTISVPFYYYDKYIHNFTLIRDELFECASGNDPIYIREIRDGGDGDEAISGKYYKVILKDVIQVSQNYKVGEGTLEFETVELPYGISIATTQSIQTDGLLNDGNWAFGMGLETVDDSELIYTQKVTSSKQFKFFNAGNVEVHPFVSYLKIRIKNVVGSTKNLSIVNKTNDSRFDIKVAVPPTDVWVIDGPVIQRNSLMAVKDTSKKFISLSPGWNTFELIGATSADVSLDFNFLYR